MSGASCTVHWTDIYCSAVLFPSDNNRCWRLIAFKEKKLTHVSFLYSFYSPAKFTFLTPGDVKKGEEKNSSCGKRISNPWCVFHSGDILKGEKFGLLFSFNKEKSPAWAICLFKQRSATQISTKLLFSFHWIERAFHYEDRQRHCT